MSAKGLHEPSPAYLISKPSAPRADIQWSPGLSLSSCTHMFLSSRGMHTCPEAPRSFHFPLWLAAAPHLESAEENKLLCTPCRMGMVNLPKIFLRLCKFGLHSHQLLLCILRSFLYLFQCSTCRLETAGSSKLTKAGDFILQVRRIHVVCGSQDFAS